MTTGTPEDVQNFDYAKTDKEVAERAERFRYADPYQNDIPPALLSSKDFIKYVKATAMVYPFFEDKSRIKAASYEIRAGKKAIWWDESGRKIERAVDEEHPLFLPKNSITFVQIESTIRLPQYIALRFNLRITQVHRGLLLGTGPLIDPEFEGDILIPIHNLTDQDYSIPVSEGLIWVEFTKTSSPPDPNWPFRLERRKSLQTPEQYLQKANGGNPIRSSLGDAIAEFRQRAEAAERDARRARQANQIVAAGALVTFLLATLGIIIGLYSYFGTMAQMAGAVQDKASTALAKVETLASRTDEDRKNADEDKKAIDAARQTIDDMKKDVAALHAEIAALKPPASPAPAPQLRKATKRAGQVRRRRR
jgi:deoxycytidine triphosphate deaminase